jgi:hypothetical protein
MDAKLSMKRFNWFKFQPISIREMSNNSTEQINAEKQIWNDYKCVKMGPCEMKYNMSGIYGGRGVIATEDIKPGTIIVREEPFLKLKTNKLEDMLKEICSRDDLATQLRPFSILHPISFSHLEKSELEAFILEYDEMVNRVFEFIPKKNQSIVNREVIMRIGLALRFNGFSSGIYLFLSIFNHQCKANAIKFAPEHGKPYSEIVAIENIKKGQEITINYLTPFDQSNERRKEQIEKQFHFTCKCSLCTSDEFNKYKDFDILTLEKKLFIVESLMASGFWTKSLNSLMEYKTTYNIDEKNLVLLRLNKLIVDACASLLENDQGSTETSILFLQTSFEIYRVQILLFPDHCDVARTCNDIANGIESLLNFDRQALFEHFPEIEGKEKSLKRRKEFYTEYKRISALYE